MKKSFCALFVIMGGIIISWLSYAYGFNVAYEIGVDRSLHAAYGKTKSQKMILALISQNETRRAVDMLDALIEADISYIKEYTRARNELDYFQILKGTIYGYGVNASSIQRFDINALDELAEK